jgi:hypothetical protein
MPVPSQGHYVFTVFRLLTDFVCLYTYQFWLSLCKIVQSSVILLLPLFIIRYSVSLSRTPFKFPWSIVNQETILSTYILNYKIFGTLFGFYCPFDFPVYVFSLLIVLSCSQFSRPPCYYSPILLALLLSVQSMPITLMLWVRISLMLDTTLCNKVCHWLAAGR